MARLTGQSLELVWELVDAQHGVVTLAQLRELGFSGGTIEHWLHDRLHPLHRGVYAVGRPQSPSTGTGSPPCWHAEPGAALSHDTAGALLGILESANGRAHVSVALGRHPQHAEVTVHRRTPMPPVTTCEGITVVDPLFTLLDLWSARSLGQVEALVNEADKLGLIRIDEATRRIAEMRGRPGVRKLYQVLGGHHRTDSALERRFLRLVTAAGLPKPVTQKPLHGFRVDFYWPELGLVVETDGLTYHRTPSEQARDRVRDQQLTAAGLTCLRFTNAQVRRDERTVIHTLKSVVERLRPTGVRLARL
jgi:very-short-patch-repair endonuclease